MPEVLERIARSPVEHLEMARDRITPIEHWTTGHDALFDKADRNSDVYAKSSLATCWCAYGSIVSVPSTISVSRVVTIFATAIVGEVKVLELADHQIPELVADFNDSHGHSQVLNMFGKAIKLARSIQ